MTFQVGQSGNPKGRAKGSLNRRTQLSKLLEPYAEPLVKKMIELALQGDSIALRLCIERLIPKARHELIPVDLPSHFNEKNIFEFKHELFAAILQGTMSVDEGEKILKLITNTLEKPSALPKIPNDITAAEASKIYQQVMGG